MQYSKMLFLLFSLFLTNACTNKNLQESCIKDNIETRINQQDSIEIRGLREVEFKDTLLLKNLTKISKSDCFNTNDYYIVDFFTSQLASKTYFITIDEFVYNKTSANFVDSYIILNGKTFMMSSSLKIDIFNRTNCILSTPFFCA